LKIIEILLEIFIFKENKINTNHFTLISWYDGGLNPRPCLATNSSIFTNSSLFATLNGITLL